MKNNFLKITLTDREVNALIKAKLAGSQWAIYSVLVRHCGNHNSCKILMDEIIGNLNGIYCERAMWKGMKKLEESGLLERFKNSSRLGTFYFLPHRQIKEEK